MRQLPLLALSVGPYPPARAQQGAGRQPGAPTAANRTPVTREPACIVDFAPLSAVCSPGPASLVQGKRATEAGLAKGPVAHSPYRAATADKGQERDLRTGSVRCASPGSVRTQVRTGQLRNAQTATQRLDRYRMSERTAGPLRSRRRRSIASGQGCRCPEASHAVRSAGAVGPRQHWALMRTGSVRCAPRQCACDARTVRRAMRRIVRTHCAVGAHAALHTGHRCGGRGIRAAVPTGKRRCRCGPARSGLMQHPYRPGGPTTA